MKRKAMLWVSIVVGIVLIYIGVIYATHTAGTLPHYYPGYATGSAIKHFKHSLAAFILGILCFVYAWFQG